MCEGFHSVSAQDDPTDCQSKWVDLTIYNNQTLAPLGLGPSIKLLSDFENWKAEL